MNKFVFVAVIGFAVSLSSANQVLRAQIQSRYNTVAKASVGDLSQIMPQTAKLLTSDFRWVESGGSEYNREFYIGAQTRFIDTISKVFTAKNEMLGYQIDGIYFRCRVKSTMTYRKKGFTVDRHVGVSVSDDVWVRTIHGWKMYKSVGIRDSDTIVQRAGTAQSAAVMTARMTSAGVVQPAAALAFPSLKHCSIALLVSNLVELSEGDVSCDCSPKLGGAENELKDSDSPPCNPCSCTQDSPLPFMNLPDSSSAGVNLSRRISSAVGLYGWRHLPQLRRTRR